MPLFRTNLEIREKIICEIFGMFMSNNFSWKACGVLKSTYRSEYSGIWYFVRNIRVEVELFACDKKIRLRFLQYKNVIEKVLKKFRIIGMNETGKKFINRNGFVSYREFCDEMAKNRVNMSIEEARGILGEYHIAAFYPFCNYDYVIAEDPLSNSSKLVMGGRLGKFDEELLRFCEKEDCSKPTIQLANNFLREYFVLIEPWNLENMINGKGFKKKFSKKLNKKNKTEKVNSTLIQVAKKQENTELQQVEQQSLNGHGTVTVNDLTDENKHFSQDYSDCSEFRSSFTSISHQFIYEGLDIGDIPLEEDNNLSMEVFSDRISTTLDYSQEILLRSTSALLQKRKLSAQIKKSERSIDMSDSGCRQ